jgi:hypothetical protein
MAHAARAGSYGAPPGGQGQSPNVDAIVRSYL